MSLLFARGQSIGRGRRGRARLNFPSLFTEAVGAWTMLLRVIISILVKRSESNYTARNTLLERSHGETCQGGNETAFKAKHVENERGDDQSQLLFCQRQRSEGRCVTDGFSGYRSETVLLDLCHSFDPCLAAHFRSSTPRVADASRG